MDEYTQRNCLTSELVRVKVSPSPVIDALSVHVILTAISGRHSLTMATPSCVVCGGTRVISHSGPIAYKGTDNCEQSSGLT
jgi:hypothetical protein